MPELARDGERLPRLEAQVEKAIVLVAGETEEILAFQGLMLTLLRRPAMDLQEVRAELERFTAVEAHYIQIGRESSEKWQNEVSQLVDTAFASLSPMTSLAPISNLILAMATGILLWEQDRSLDEPKPLLVLSVPMTENVESVSGQLIFERPRAGLLFEPGSLSVRQVISNVIGSPLWFVGIFRNSAGRVRSAEAVARALVTNLRDKREKEIPAPVPLLTLASTPPGAWLKNKSGIVLLFLHGLMSTDLGTFDGLINRLKAPKPADIKVELPPEVNAEVMRATFDRAVTRVGWPHDTLTSIDQNAHQLSRVIETQLASSDCKLVFICHSRGGLVARSTAIKLYERANEWSDRLCCCITFGSPHAGVGLAEHPDRKLGAYILAGMIQGELAAYADIAAYIEQRGKIEGIDDLRPASAAGNPYLRRLEEDEWKIPPPPRGRVRQLKIHAIGGIAPAGDPQGALIGRLGRYYSHWYSYYSGETHHDLVVPLASATAANEERMPQNMNCDHFHYFKGDNPLSEPVTEAISLIWQTTGLVDQLPKPVQRTLRELIEEVNEQFRELKDIRERLKISNTTDPKENLDRAISVMTPTVQAIRDLLDNMSSSEAEMPDAAEATKILSDIWDVSGRKLRHIIKPPPPRTGPGSFRDRVRPGRRGPRA
jgi:hypothetical protein